MPTEVRKRTTRKPGAVARFFCCVGFGVLGFAPLSASAQSAAAESLGVRSCADLVAAQTGDQMLYAGFGAWIGGYLTAANAYEPETFDLTPWQPMELAAAQITAACKQQETATVAEVAASYVKHLRGGRMTEPSGLLRLRSGDKALFVYKSVLADVRQRLEMSGAAITDPEGEFGASFGRAMLRYQKENGLPETGLPDTQTLIRLLN